MTRVQFDNLKVGDMCKIFRGHDAERLCEVAYIEGDCVLVRSADGRYFKSSANHGRLRLMNWRELTLVDKRTSSK